MIANPEFDLKKHDASDSKAKFGYYFLKRGTGQWRAAALPSWRIRKGARTNARASPLGIALSAAMRSDHGNEARIGFLGSR
jgi:hypothetical protein